MGVDTKLVVYAESESQAQTACRAAFDRVAQLEDVASDYRPTSELMQLCAKSGGPPVPISQDLRRLLSHSLLIAKQTNGAFDPTLGPLTHLWRATRKSEQLPSPEVLAEARLRTGYNNIVITPHTARLSKKGMLLDLGGIAKGDAGDQAIGVLKRHGITSALFQSGGDIVLSNPPPDSDGWTVTIPHSQPPIAGSHPRASEVITPAGSETILILSNCAVSTSGDTNQYVDIDGRRYSHLLDRRTGLGLTTRTLATVIAPTGLQSDPLSKAASLLGPDKLEELLDHYPRTTIYARRVGIGED